MVSASAIGGLKRWQAEKFHSPAVSWTPQKIKRTESGIRSRCAFWEVSVQAMDRRSFETPAWPLAVAGGLDSSFDAFSLREPVSTSLENAMQSQSRYRIWSVQKRSSRCSDLFRVAN